MTRQPQTTELQQVALPFSPEPEQAEVSDAVLLRITDIQDVIRLCVSVSGLLDKQIYPVLGLEKAQFSRMMSGAHNFPACKLQTLQEVCGNNIIQRWWALHTGYDLTKHQTTLEEENDALRAELALAKRDIETIRKFMQGIHK